MSWFRKKKNVVSTIELPIYTRYNGKEYEIGTKKIAVTGGNGRLETE